jgi:uncharacterized integral membrane protein (TIGR00698 family)
MLCVGVALAARAASWLEVRLLGHPVLDAVPLAIIFGLAIRSTLPLPASTRAGICFSSKTLLEIAVVLLGSLIDPAAVMATGPALLLGIAAVVALSVPTSYLLGRMAGLDKPLALLIGVGNSICGNSAIAAVAPVIRAPARDVAASITFTAVLGIAAVLFLPSLPGLIGYSANQYGIFAGLTVYAVPQVLAATAPVSQLSLQVGTVVKLLRVLMLGPVIVAISLWFAKGSGGRRPSAATMLPWFIIGFVAMVATRSAGLIPGPVLPALAAITEWLTVISMAALGLSADLRVLARVGGRVFLAASLSLAALGLFSYGLIRILGIA